MSRLIRLGARVSSSAYSRCMVSPTTSGPAAPESNAADEAPEADEAPASDDAGEPGDADDAGEADDATARPSVSEPRCTTRNVEPSSTTPPSGTVAGWPAASRRPWANVPVRLP